MKKIVILFALANLINFQSGFADNILVVMSDVSEMKLKNGFEYKTGFYLNELMEPVKIFLDEGHSLTFATPSGLAPTLDPVSDTPDHFLDTSHISKL